MWTPPPWRRVSIAVYVAIVSISGTAVAQTPAANGPQPSGSRFLDWALPFAALGGALYLHDGLNAPECNWCDRGPNGEDTLNGFDRWARNALLWPDGHRDEAARLSDAISGSLVAVPYLILWPKGQHAGAIQTMAWVFAVDATASGIPKRLFARERPVVHFSEPFSTSESHPNASFPSNHTSRAFASVFAAVRLCQVTDCDHEERIWWVGLPLASATGLLRIGADKHYALDVLTGAAVGAAVGWYVPGLTRLGRSGSSRFSAQPFFENGAGVTLTWAWQ